jgi:(1->4)-alpha-D-glucan 1-alpha-D-glucosylmutase
VDFEYRASGLASEANLLSLLPMWRDGRIKQQLIAKLLELREVHPSLFRDGSYEPIEAGDAICAFARRHAGLTLVVAVDLYPWRKQAWREGHLPLPGGLEWDQLRPIVGPQSPDGALQVLFRDLPVYVAAKIA